jgi:type VI secretion system secreted protein Hcp
MRIKSLMVAAQLCLLSMLAPVGAQAALDMFLTLGDLKGESQDKAHPGAIDILAWSWGLSNSGTTHVGGGGGAGKANVQDLSLTKYVDRATPPIMLACAKGQHFDEAKLIVRKAGGKGSGLEYIVITMNEVLVTSVSTGGSAGEDRLTENISLNFAKVKVEYTTQKEDGGKGDTIEMVYNIAENTAD